MEKKNTKSATKSPAQIPSFGVVDVQWLVSHIKEVQILRQEHQANLVALQQWVKAANAEIAAQNMPEDKNSLTQKYQLELNQKQQAMQQNHLQKVQVVDANLSKLIADVEVQAVDANLSKLIADVAKKENLDYVFAKGTLVFGGQDITQKVADAMIQEK